MKNMKKNFFLAVIMIMILAVPSMLGKAAAVSDNALAEAGPKSTPEPNRRGSNGPVNPLSGLPAKNADLLKYPPAMISISNFPPSARPQAGLSVSPVVYELYIGEGTSRFLATFYGDFPGIDVAGTGGASGGLDNNTGGENNGEEVIQPDNATIGPIRSGRLPYESLRGLNNGFLVMASAYKGVAANLGKGTSIFGSDEGDINSAMIPVSKLVDIAVSQKPLAENQTLESNIFESEIPQGGQTADRLVYFYANLNQLYWEYNADKGAYTRFQDNADGKTFSEMTDRLTGEPVAIENVIVLYANHSYCNETVLDIELRGVKKNPALLFRDGKMYKIFWTTWAGEYEQTTGFERPIRFIDENGNLFPLKPGQTWMHLTPTYTRLWESPVSTDAYIYLNQQKAGSGQWVTRFYPDMMIFDKAVCDRVKMQ